MQWVQGVDGGTPIQITTENVGPYLRQGYRLVPPEQASRLSAAKEHEGIVSMLGAAGQGAIETLLPVVGPLVESPLYPLEKQRSLKEAHPFSTGVGMVGGAIAGTLATAGLGAGTAAGGAAAAARGTAPELLANLGAKVAAGVEASAGSNALGRITAAAASQAVQGAGYAGADWANRKLQGDPKANAEQLFHQGVAAALFGGALGAAGGAMSKAADGHFEDFVEQLRAIEARGGMKATGAIQKELTQWTKSLGKDGAEKLAKISRYLGEEGGVGFRKSFPEMLELAETKFKAPAVIDMEQILAKANTGKKGSVGFFDEVFDRILNDPKIKRWSKDTLDRRTYNSFIDHLKEVQREYATLNPDGSIAYYNQITPEGLHKLSMNFGTKSRSYTGTRDPQSNALTAAYDTGRIAVRARLDQLFNEVEKSGMAKGLEKAWHDAKFRYQAGLFLEDGATRGLLRSQGNNQGSPLEVMGALTGAVAGGGHGLGTGAVTSALTGAGVALVRREGAAIQNAGARALANWLEKAQVQSGRTIGQSVERIFQAGGGEASALAAKVLDSHRVSREDFPKVAARYTQAARDPDYLARQITDNFGPLVEGAGSTALALHGTAVAAAQHLASKLPTYEKAGPLDRDYTPSRPELAALQRHAAIVHSPEMVLHQIASGTYTAEDGLTLAAVYPTLAPQIKQAVAEALTEKLARGETIPSRSRLGLSQFLGSPLNSSQTPQTIAAVQAAYAASAKPQQAQPPPKEVKFKSSENLASSSQRKTSLDT
jgi:hypothetical protein